MSEHEMHPMEKFIRKEAREKLPGLVALRGEDWVYQAICRFGKYAVAEMESLVQELKEVKGNE